MLFLLFFTLIEFRDYCYHKYYNRTFFLVSFVPTSQPTRCQLFHWVISYDICLWRAVSVVTKHGYLPFLPVKTCSVIQVSGSSTGHKGGRECLWRRISSCCIRTQVLGPRTKGGGRGRYFSSVRGDGRCKLSTKVTGGRWKVL